MKYILFVIIINHWAILFPLLIRVNLRTKWYQVPNAQCNPLWITDVKTKTLPKPSLSLYFSTKSSNQKTNVHKISGALKYVGYKMCGQKGILMSENELHKKQGEQVEGGEM